MARGFSYSRNYRLAVEVAVAMLLFATVVHVLDGLGAPLCSFFGEMGWALLELCAANITAGLHASFWILWEIPAQLEYLPQIVASLWLLLSV
jgi:hypothetical protein